MKKYALIALLLSIQPLYSIGDSCDIHENFSHSFIFPRPAHSRVAVDQALWHNIIHEKNGTQLSAVQCSILHQNSTESAPIARYFLFNGKNSLRVAGDGLGELQKKQRDIRAEWLNLPSTFCGDLCLAPEQKQTIFSFSHNQDLKKFSDYAFFEHSWISIDMPIAIVENDLNLTQKNIINPGSGSQSPVDIVESFAQKTWQYGKICGSTSSIQLADLTLKLGRIYTANNNFEIAYYSILNLPTGSGQNPEFLFDAFAGFNRHFGFGGGVNVQVVLNRDTSWYTLCLSSNLQSIFFARNSQLRTFDLKYKPWSRYMQYVHHDGGRAQSIPGVNVLTRKTRVRPFSMADMSISLRFKTEKTEWEIGYNLWGHGDEKLELHEECPPVFGIKGTPSSEDVCAVTASTSTIKTLAVNNDTTFTPIKDIDIDLKSAAAQATINHKVHVSMGIVNKGNVYDGFVGVGLFYETPKSNRDLKVIGGWAKCGASF